MINTDDLRIANIDPIIAPLLLIKELPVNEKAANLISATREHAGNILKGRDPRLLVVVGPCSIHDPGAALEYGQRLRGIAAKYKDELLLVMRVYFEKPRTTIGWKGLINDPDMDNTFDINRGLRAARKLLLDLAAIDLPAGTEFLDTISPQYIADLVSWGAIGARTTESQIHRQLASGLSMPVGFKNGTGGSIQIAVDAINAARFPHHFLSVTKHGVSAIVSTVGNDACHLILRGSSTGPNCDPESIAKAVEQLESAGLSPHLMVDCSHGNSRKDYRQQPAVAEEIANQIAEGSDAITAVMIESNLIEGAQSASDSDSLVYGKSITDACVGWDTTVDMLNTFATAVQKRQQKRGGRG